MSTLLALLLSLFNPTPTCSADGAEEAPVCASAEDEASSDDQRVTELVLGISNGF